MTLPLQGLRNVGLFAHVDAGKTTTTEQMLYNSGQLRALGSVDSGTTQTDWLDVERERGISVRAAVTRLTWGDTAINLVDTPGHVDFLAEVERSLRVMDGAVLIVSAAEGVQAQTEVIWQALRAQRIPTLIYVNKMDRIGANQDRVLGQIHRLLTKQAAPVNAPDGAEGAFASVHGLLAEDKLPAWAAAYREQLAAMCAERSEEAMEAYLEEGRLSDEALQSLLIEGTHSCELFPVLFGASGRGIGVTELLEAVVRLLPPPAIHPEGEVSGVVFKIERDPAMGRIAYVRLYGGTIRNRESIRNHSRDLEEKVTQIRRIIGQRTEDIGLLAAGDIAAVYGWSRARIGDIVGSPAHVPGEQRLAVPLLTVQVHWRSEAEYPAVVAAFQELADEDPQLDLQWMQDERELHLKVMGQIQMEVLAHMLLSRFGLEVTFGAPTVIYKETPAAIGEGFVAYLAPKPCWAILRFHIEPGPRGSGVVYSSVVRNERLLDSYQNEVARRVPEALQQGLRGWEVTDVRITLVEGEHHVWHTHPLDFVIATPMGIMDGLANTGTKLLEPLLRFRLSVPEEYGGKLMNELMLMRAEFESPTVHGERMEIEGLLPVAASLDFPARLGSMTKGRGTLSAFFAGYQECPPDVEAERTRRGVNPLDQAKYILAVRNALST
ncbi:ribosomal protection tetracycline resistance protein [Paenibacillus phyllosphaerae]|uniref:Ribosomal protection tetracycline resistance protein n=1 Tax=Paenibacillus phyllosphaerae TaxID=274593 RepID=A0A7W5AXR4_9BACL|nr:TetM/TetW/TetO/TetS family tetracycline resistance ribosomal protection protein [Paenibacillus phyllosphaerae]MBB3110719.1 ribosomal protection tetracycline resistance protein [Paenibacillus phyllosphaerae]